MTVNPELNQVTVSWASQRARNEKERTICLVVLVHVDKRVKIDVRAVIVIGVGVRAGHKERIAVSEPVRENEIAPRGLVEAEGGGLRIWLRARTDFTNSGSGGADNLNGGAKSDNGKCKSQEDEP